MDTTQLTHNVTSVQLDANNASITLLAQPAMTESSYKKTFVLITVAWPIMLTQLDAHIARMDAAHAPMD